MCVSFGVRPELRTPIMPRGMADQRILIREVRALVRHERRVTITPKTLTQRLRGLEEVEIVAADREPGRREVWYRLSTPAGRDVPG